MYTLQIPTKHNKDQIDCDLLQKKTFSFSWQFFAKSMYDKVWYPVALSACGRLSAQHFAKNFVGISAIILGCRHKNLPMYLNL